MRREVFGTFSVSESHLSDRPFLFSERKASNGEIPKKRMSKMYEHDSVVWIICIGILFVTGNVFLGRSSYLEMKTLGENHETIGLDIRSKDSSEDRINDLLYPT
jgi:hypothetical protein